MAQPHLRSLEDFDSISEVSDPQTQQISYTTIELIQNGHAYFGQIFKPKSAITLEECRTALKMVPDWEIFPELPKDLGLTIATKTESSYVKQPNLSIYELVEGTSLLADLLLHEAKVMDQLQKKPQQNLVRYHGVHVEGGRIVGLVFDRYQRNLLDYIKQGHEVNVGVFMEQLGAAITHLHSLDLAHNDINPENIMLDSTGSLILIDFGSCQKEGQRVLSAGTPGWIEQPFTYSHKNHDFFALGKLLTWLIRPELDLAA